MYQNTSTQIRLLRLKQVISITGLSRSTLYLMISKNEFPRQINLTGARCVAWLESEIIEWINLRIAKSRIKQTE